MKTYKVQKTIFENSPILENGNLSCNRKDVYFFEKGVENFQDVRIIVEGTEYQGVMNISDKEILVKEGYRGFRECDNVVMPPGSILIQVDEGDERNFTIYKLLESEELFEEV